MADSSEMPPVPSGMRAPNREEMETFLREGIAMMRRQDTRDLLKSKSCTAPGLKLIELQRAGWDKLGIDQDIGCSYLENVEKVCPGDSELILLRSDFVREAQRSFIRALEDKRPAKLETKKKMPREVIIAFFDSCNTKMDLPETHLRLKKHIEKTGKMPNTVIIEMQRDMLEVHGWERDHGCNMLSNISKDFPNDQELFGRFEGWRQKATQTCMTVIKKHQVAGGGMPAGLMEANPEMEKLQEKAKAEIEAMTPKERGELVEKMQKKMQVFANLPQEAKMSHMQKLSEEEKLEFVKTQILMMSIMRQQWQAQQQAGGQDMAAPSQQDQMDMDAPGRATSAEEQRRLEEEVEREVEAEIAKSAAKAMPKDLAPPTQQMMM
mmetsp:Transcript_2609/g.6862  ORF Transcript_2609/g.6862 Transcript_2609/m.6862 type:complete len:379 (-) Transcript_2609:145-1281(-)